MVHGSPRPTGDLDHVAAIPYEAIANMQELAGPQSELAKKYKVYVQYASVADTPDDYETRLREMFPGCYSRLRLFALDPHDLILSKLTRNSPVDDGDVQFLIAKGVVDPDSLCRIYEKELRPRLANVDRHDLTLQLWLEYFRQ